MVMEARKSKIKVPRVPMFDENLFSGSYMAIFSLVPSQGGKKAPGGGDGWASFIRALIPLMRVPLSLLPNKNWPGVGLPQAGL